MLATGVALAAMAVDHLVGTEREEGESGLADPVTFAVTAALSLATAALLLGWFVPRERRAGPDRSARSGVACSVLSIVPGVALLWLGFPFVVAGAGVELGLAGRTGARRRLALAATVLGATLVGLGAAVYLVALVAGGVL
jgi:hypothetical protein